MLFGVIAVNRQACYSAQMQPAGRLLGEERPTRLPLCLLLRAGDANEPDACSMHTVVWFPPWEFCERQSSQRLRGTRERCRLIVCQSCLTIASSSLLVFLCVVVAVIAPRSLLNFFILLSFIIATRSHSRRRCLLRRRCRLVVAFRQSESTVRAMRTRCPRAR